MNIILIALLISFSSSVRMKGEEEKQGEDKEDKEEMFFIHFGPVLV